jgi:HSP20 family protein
MFDDMLGSLFPAVAKDVGSDFFNAEDVTIEAAIPGMEKDDVTVEVTDGILTISGASNQDGEVQDSQYVKREIKKSSFKRSFRLGENLDPESISGSYNKGILTLVLPKVKPTEEESKTRTIKIS